MQKAKGQKRSSTENELMQHVDMISNPKVKAFIARKKQEKLENVRFRQSGGQRGLEARLAKKKIVLESSSAEEESNDEMDESEEEEVQAVKQVATIKTSSR